MEKYESKQYQIRRPAAQIYAVLSDFRNFTPIVQGRVEEWQADETSCSFRFKGMSVRLQIIDKEPENYIKISGDDRSPLEFTFWVQMKQVEAYDTRIRLVLHTKLNMVMRMMIGSKLQSGLDQMAVRWRPPSMASCRAITDPASAIGTGRERASARLPFEGQ